METKVIYGTELAAKVKASLKYQVQLVKHHKPTLAVIQVGDNPASQTYVRNKVKACEEVGIKSKVIHFGEDTSEEVLQVIIDWLNKDTCVDGILVQMPLPKHINESKIISMIDPNKDVDGLHPENVGKLHSGKYGLLPCTPLGIMEILKEAEVDLSGKHAVVLGRSKLVGAPVAKLLMDKDCTVTICQDRKSVV